MFNPIDYLLENSSWYDPIYNIAWVLFMLYALTLPVLLLALFKLPALRPIQPTRTWADHFRTYGYLLAAAFVIFSFRLIPYWIFNDCQTPPDSVPKAPPRLTPNAATSTCQRWARRAGESNLVKR